jgi:GNAT superfamily N-acetyltransferase
MSSQITVRLLGPGDGPILEMLAHNDAAFDVEGRGASKTALPAAAAAAYLADPAILHWIAEQHGEVVGTLCCYVQRRRAGDPLQLMVYEIGVRATHRRRGIGRQLISVMDAWMAEHGVRKVWVLADNPGAESFYSACGFHRDEPQPVEMSRHGVPPASRPGLLGRNEL